MVILCLVSAAKHAGWSVVAAERDGHFLDLPMQVPQQYSVVAVRFSGRITENQSFFSSSVQEDVAQKGHLHHFPVKPCISL